MKNDSKFLIKIQNLGLKIKEKIILEDINLTISPQEIITIIGPNGAGKSTLIKIILNLIKPSNGLIIKNTQLKIGYMPQNSLFPEQIPISAMKFLQLNNNIDLKKQILAYPELNIEHLLPKSIHDLSGGELQRILLMRALLNNPNLLVLDEPTKSIDVNGQIEFYKLCATLKNKINCAIFMASHDLHFVMSDVNSVICLNKHICCQGLPSDISNHQEYINMFGNTVNQLGFYHHHHDHQHNLD